MTWRPHRRGAEVVEWLDAGRGTPAEIDQCYSELDRVNRHIAGYRATFDPLDPLVTGLAGAATGRLDVVDVAGGGGEFAARFSEWGAARGWPIRVTLVDLHPMAVERARTVQTAQHAVQPVRGDALRLPLRDRSVDIAHSAAFFHHLSTAAACDVLGEMCRVSRNVVLVNDLVRSWVAATAITMLAGLLSRNRLIRHDGRVSVLKSFTPSELLSLPQAREVSTAGCFRWSLKRFFPYRMTLIGVRAEWP